MIKTPEEHARMLAEIEQLVEQDPEPGSAEADRLALLSLLADDYEVRAAPPLPLDPVEAIEFRMDQMGLAPRDLIPFLGSRSKVSEVLSRRRPLTLSMIRALNQGLGIPLQSLVAEGSDASDDSGSDPERYPVAVMVKRGWLSESPRSPAQVRAALNEFLEPLRRAGLATTAFRRSTHVRSGRAVDLGALEVWTARVVRLAEAEEPPPFDARAVDLAFMRRLARVSAMENGPVLAKQVLRETGIAMVVEKHLPRTHVDGCAILGIPGRAIVGLTLRYDRLDHFWFTLMHEVAHLSLHYDSARDFFDDLECETGLDAREREADELAREALVPAEAWNRSAARLVRTPQAAGLLAQELGVHAAVVAGQIRNRSKSYRVLSQHVGQGQVRRWFPEVRWDQD